MDNLTHAFVGVLLAETSLRVAARSPRFSPDRRLRAEVFTVAVIGNNAADGDILYSRFVGGRDFGYLLQHRGFTHTVPIALLIGVALLAAVLLVRRVWPTELESPRDRRGLGLLAVVALASPLLHIAMDFANNYGVHPFWPVDSAWFYGDTLFILEPTLWIAILAPLAFNMTSRRARLGLWAALGVGTAALWYGPLVPRLIAVVLAVTVVTLLFVARRLSPGRRVVLANGLFIGTIASFALGSRAAKAVTVDESLRELPQARMVDVAVTPTPANPFCWNLVWMGIDGDDYVVRLGRVRLLPALASFPGGACAFGDDPDTTAPMKHLIAPTPTTRESREVAREVSFSQEYRRPLAELVGLASTRCEVAAMLQFARAPYLTDVFPDGTRVVGDLRYDRKPERDFADVPFPAVADPSSCPPNLPPWIPPRADLLHDR